MSTRGKKLIIVGLGLLVLILVFRMCRKTKQSLSEVPSQKQSDSPLPSSPVEPPRPSSPQSPQLDPKVNAREQVDLAEVDIVRDERGATAVSISIKQSPVCFPGDLDLLQKVFGKTEGLIFAAEPMDSALGKGFSRMITPDEIRKGLSFRAPISLEKNAVWTLSICGDKAGKRSCLGKQPVNFNQALASQQTEEASNALYYFQFAVLGKKLTSVYTGLAEGGADLKRHLKEKEGLTDATLLKHIDKAFQLMHAIKSVPPYTNRSGDILWIEIPVAGLDPMACRK